MTSYEMLQFRNHTQPAPIRNTLVNIEHIADQILGYLSLYSLNHLSHTCCELFFVIDHFLSKERTVNDIYSKFFRDPLAFRMLQVRTQCLVSGSQPLQYMSRLYWPESDLDLYTNDRHIQDILSFLYLDGYTQLDCSWDHRNVEGHYVSHENSALKVIYYMEKEYSTQVFLVVREEIQTEAIRHTVKLQVMLSRWHPVAVILGFHSMGAINFFTPIHVVSLYAHATLDEWCSLVLYQVTDWETCASRDLTKYRNCGFDLVLSGKDELGRSCGLDCVY
ncbi:hypothetical protein M422DRAFT_241013 [Sphaerobolus stellatus SS14]|nr:hypothetical protein M422DRAFT_241013 [Sphaerobolus stellatus SS14]